MRINGLKINSYGKLKDKDIAFKNGINVVYGENEKGKSTLLNSIVNILYGASKTKKGKDISDYDKYKPWEGEEFSGKISYSLDNDDSYEVFREFGKKNPTIYNKNMEDISKMYSIDKSSGSQFFYEQTNVDEGTFTSTVVSFQDAVEIDNQTQNVLLQKIANTSSTGDDGISYKKAIEKLSKKQLDEIGTQRSQDKPINVAIREIQRLTNINEELKQYEGYKYEIEDKKYKLENELKTVKYKNDFLGQLYRINQEQSIESGKLKYNEEKIDDLEAKIEALLSEKETVKNGLKSAQKMEKRKANTMPYVLVIVLSVIATIAIFLVSKNPIAFIGLIIAVVGALMMSSNMKKIAKYNDSKSAEMESVLKYNKDIERRMYEIDAQIEILEKNQKDQINEAESIKNEVMKNIENKKESLKSNYAGKIESSSINYFMNSNSLQSEIDQTNRMMNEKNMELHRLELDKENILPRLEEMADNEESIAANKEIYNNLVKKNNAINMAKEIIEVAYQKMKSDVTPRFTENLSKNIAIITNNKYKRIVINEEDGILVELQNGEYKRADLLSKGTIEQLYLAFRLSIIEDISEEKMPIIFDEIFAFFDDFRLRETLKNLYENYSKNHQIILFTCTNREVEALRDLNLDYNLIRL